jgi:hypothetical protein
MQQGSRGSKWRTLCMSSRAHEGYELPNYLMRRVLTATACLAVLVALPRLTSAQTADEQTTAIEPSRVLPLEHLTQAPHLLDSDLTQRGTELKRWMDEFLAWEEWSAEWNNRREPGWLTGFRARREKPVPPEWLADECRAVFDDSDSVDSACAMLARWKEDPAARELRQAREAALAQQEGRIKKTFWEQVHMDVMWPAMQVHSHTYGVIGMHVTTTVKGRLHVFIAPGAMLLNLPAADGTRVWRVATNYGLGFHLLDFTFPGNRLASLHLNLAKSWILSDVTDLIVGRTMDVAGFSITFNKRR